MAEYGFDLVAEWETVTYRRLWVLLQGLPVDAALWREENTWTTQDELAAALIELTDIASRRVVRALGGDVKGEPIRIGRPERDVEPQRVERIITTDTAEIAAWFAAHN